MAPWGAAVTWFAPAVRRSLGLTLLSDVDCYSVPCGHGGATIMVVVCAVLAIVLAPHVLVYCVDYVRTCMRGYVSMTMYDRQ